MVLKKVRTYLRDVKGKRVMVDAFEGFLSEHPFARVIVHRRMHDHSKTSWVVSEPQTGCSVTTPEMAWGSKQQALEAASHRLRSLGISEKSWNDSIKRNLEKLHDRA